MRPSNSFLRPFPLIALAFTCLCFVEASALKPPITLVDSIKGSYYPRTHGGTDHLEYLADLHHQWRIMDITSPPLDTLFVPSSKDISNFGETDAAIWVRFQLRDETTQTRRWVIYPKRYRTFVLQRIEQFGLLPTQLESQFMEIGLYVPVKGTDDWYQQAAVDSSIAEWAVKRRSIYVPTTGGIYLHKQALVDSSFAERDIRHRSVAFLLPDAVDWQRPFYMRFNHENALSSRIKIVSLERLYHQYRSLQIELGMYYGLIVALAMYNFFLFLSLRDISYLYYVLYLVALNLFSASYQGIAFEYLWPDSPLWNRDALYFFGGAAAIFIALFTCSFLNTIRTAPRLHRTLLVMAGLGVVDCAISLYSNNLADRLSYLIALILLPTCLASGICAWRRGFRPARYYLLSWSIFITCGMVYIIHVIGIYRVAGLASTDVLHLGIACEAMLLSLGLADRINLLRQEAARQETARQQAQQAALAKSQFLANMSHELRTPMNAVINFSSLILEGIYGKISPELRDAVEEIDHNSEHLLELINDVLEVSRIEANAVQLDLAACVPAACIGNAAATLKHDAEQKGLRLQHQIEGELPLIHADERRLSQHVLANLLKNAIKFTEAGEVCIGARAQEGNVLFWVADTGIGIAAEEQDAIFDIFHRLEDARHVEGTGLGLAIAREFVELHGGRLWVESEVGKGSTFYFSIPFHNEI